MNVDSVPNTLGMYQTSTSLGSQKCFVLVQYCLIWKCLYAPGSSLGWFSISKNYSSFLNVDRLPNIVVIISTFFSLRSQATLDISYLRYYKLHWVWPCVLLGVYRNLKNFKCVDGLNSPIVIAVREFKLHSSILQYTYKKKVRVHVVYFVPEVSKCSGLDITEKKTKKHWETHLKNIC